MNRYQILLLVILLAWPLVIFGILYLMSRLEEWVSRVDAESPEEAGLEPVAGSPPEKEVQIIFGDEIVGSPGNRRVGRSRERPEQPVEGSEDGAAGGSDSAVQSPAGKMAESGGAKAVRSSQQH
jgi:hypothetical protein